MIYQLRTDTVETEMSLQVFPYGTILRRGLFRRPQCLIQCATLYRHSQRWLPHPKFKANTPPNSQYEASALTRMPPERQGQDTSLTAILAPPKGGKT